MSNGYTQGQREGDKHTTAMALMALAMLMLPGIDAIAKWLSDSVSAGQVVWSRFVVQALLMLPFVLYRGRLRGVPRLHLHALRGALIALTTVLFFAALRYLPLADAIAIFFVEPLLLTLLSAAILGEAVGWRRLGAVVVGLAGAMLVIRPSFSAFGATALLPLGAALCFAFYLLLTRSISQRESPATMQFFAGLFAFVLMSVVLVVGEVANIGVIDPVWPTPAQWGLLLLLGVIATVGHLLVVLAFKRAPATLLAPFQYLEILGATLFGLLLFNDFPDPMALAGIGVIVSSGLYVAHRERVLSQRVRA